jgi:rRNA maturation endonuclease Nob1
VTIPIHFAAIAALTTGAGMVMVLLGFSHERLARDRRRCVSCDRVIEKGYCPSCSRR